MKRRPHLPRSPGGVLRRIASSGSGRSSSHTLASYRDTFCLLLGYAQRQLRKAPTDNHVGKPRHALSSAPFSTISKINATTAPAAGTFALPPSTPSSAMSRCIRRSTAHWRNGYSPCRASGTSAGQSPSSTHTEVTALLAAPDLGKWSGRRDRALLLLAVQTGLRAAELVGLPLRGHRAWSGRIRAMPGKGRKLRNTPLRKDTVAVLRAWLAERNGQPADPAFPTRSTADIEP